MLRCGCRPELSFDSLSPVDEESPFNVGSVEKGVSSSCVEANSLAPSMYPSHSWVERILLPESPVFAFGSSKVKCFSR